MLPEVARELVRAEVSDIAAASGVSVAPFSLLGFLWLTSNGFHNLMDVFELLIAPQPRTWWRQRHRAGVGRGHAHTALLSVACSAHARLETAGIRDAGQVPLLVQRVRVGPSWQAASVLPVFARNHARRGGVLSDRRGASRRRSPARLAGRDRGHGAVGRRVVDFQRLRARIPGTTPSSTEASPPSR